MKAAILYGPGDVRVEEIEKPVLEHEDEIIVRVKASGICGTDLHFYKHGLFQDVGRPVNSGRLLGHEFSGEVSEIAGRSRGFKRGDRVVAVSQGAHAEYIKILPRRRPNVFVIPADISFEEAATTEPLATSLHAVNLALRSQKREHFLLPDITGGPAEIDRVVIFGAGIIGLGILQVLKAMTGAEVIVTDLSARRLAMAARLGADAVINALREDPYEKVISMTARQDLRYVSEPAAMVDVVFDCVGAPRTMKGTAPLRQAISMVKFGGTVVVVALFEKSLEIDISDIVMKNISLHGSGEWSTGELSRAFEFISSGEIDRKPLITHEFSLDEIKKAYEIQAASDESVKVMLKF